MTGFNKSLIDANSPYQVKETETPKLSLKEQKHRSTLQQEKQPSRTLPESLVVDDNILFETPPCEVT